MLGRMLGRIATCPACCGPAWPARRTGSAQDMTTKPFEVSPTDPDLRPDTHPDGSPVTAPGLEPDGPEAAPDNPAEPQPEES